MPVIKQLTEQLLGQEDLDLAQATEAAEQLASPEVDLEAKKEFLLALSAKGETGTEVAAFARTFRKFAVDPEVSKWADQAIDVCGTGGDGSSSFNISTAVSFVVAAAGVPVFKHGNRSITSKCGSADLLEALGIRLDASPEQIRSSLEELNFCFFFAPAFHPAFKEIMPVRKALAAEGKRTVFNLLGPLINPGRPAHQLLGVFAEDWVARIASALDEIGLKAGFVVHGTPEPGRALDELSCAGTNSVQGFGSFSAESGQWVASEAGLSQCPFSDLSGGDLEENLKTMHDLLSGEAGSVPSGLRDTVLLNAGTALWVAGKAEDLKGGVQLADELLSSGAVAKWLEEAQSFYANF